MGDIQVVRLLQNPLGELAPAGQRGDIVRVRDGWATIYLDPNEFDRMSQAGLRRMLAEADTRPISVVGANTPAGGRGMAIHDAASRGSSARRLAEQPVGAVVRAVGAPAGSGLVR